MVEAVVRALPLKEDFDEAGAVYGMLCTLAGGLCSSPQLSHLLPLLLQVRLAYFALARLCVGCHAEQEYELVFA